MQIPLNTKHAVVQRKQEVNTHDSHAEDGHNGREAVQWQRDVDQTQHSAVGRHDGFGVEGEVVSGI